MLYSNKGRHVLQTLPQDTVIASASWEKVLELAGKPFRSQWFQVERERLLWFDKACYIDANPNAVDGSLYPSGLIEGFHLLALLDHLSNAVCYPDEPDWSGWNYGFDTVRFVSMITVNDRIRIRGNVAAVEARGERFLVSLSCTIDVEGREKPGIVALWKVLWTRTSTERAQ